MKKNNKNKLGVCVIASMIPPDYSGAGRRAYRHCLYLHNKGLLAGLVTQTTDRIKKQPDKEFLPERIVSRFPEVWKKKRFFKTSLQKIIETFYYNWKLFFYLLKRRSQINVIHVFSGDGLGTVLFSKLFKKPIVKEFTILPDTKRQTAHWSQKYIRNFIFNHSSVIVCISDALDKWCQTNKIHTPTRIIYNDTMFKRTLIEKQILRKKLLEKDFSDKNPVILFMGPRNYRKGFDIVYEVHKLLLKEYPDILLIVLGLFNESIKINGKAYSIRNFRNNKSIFCTGNVQNTQDYYHIADITLFPSRREGFGNVIIESMASGIPVVARKLDGITNMIIDDGKDGFLVDGDNVKEYANKINELLTDNIKYKAMVDAGVKKIDEKFRPEAIMTQYFDLYKELVLK